MNSSTTIDGFRGDLSSARQPAQLFAALAQETRLETYRLLMRYQPYGLAVGDIARLLAVPHNTLSTHLTVLENASLVRSRRAGRSKIYVAVEQSIAAAVAYLNEAQALKSNWKELSSAARTDDELHEFPRKRVPPVRSDQGNNVLVLCTGNSTRSILAEAILNFEGMGRIQAYSAGSNPAAKPNPLALELLRSLGYETNTLRSKSWTEFGGRGSPEMDVIVTLCDRAAKERCPKWSGAPLTFHWGIPKLNAGSRQREQKQAAVELTYRLLMNRVTTLVNLPINRLGSNELKLRMRSIGRMAGATELAVARNSA